MVMSKLANWLEHLGLARYVMISLQGLWSYSRLTDDTTILPQYSNTLIVFLGARLRGTAF